MHPILSRPDRAWIVLASCGAIGVFLAIIPLRNAGASSDDTAWFSAWGAILMILALQSWQIARFVPITTVSFPRLLLTAVASAVIFSGLWLAAGWGLALALQGVLPTLAPAMRLGWFSIWTAGGATYLAVLFLIYALDAADQGEASARRALESEVASRDAELRALRAQVDPHFLFNCLHSISAMTSREPSTARRMCLELADFFRASVRAGAEQRIPLASELQLVRGYLGIEQVRFGDRLHVQVDEAGESAGVMVPPLLLQPLAENAVRHGIATLVEGGAVQVAVRAAADRVEIVVRNPFDPDGRRPGTGVGLANVRGRLETAYRGAGMIRVDTSGDATPIFTVTLSIPAQGEPA